MNFYYPSDLPIASQKDTIIEALQQHQVVIVAGDTGSGKTTQLPKMCLEAFPDNNLLIGCTQPRRIAATSVSTRVAEELGDPNKIVSYKIRFRDRTSSATKIKFMTDGVLLAETRNDRLLSKYGIIILDEAHERSLNIDFLLGYLKQLLSRRADLKIIITSATIDTEAFAKHFNDAPVISVSGRSHPISVDYQPAEQENGDEPEGIIEHCIKAVGTLFTTRPSGDILIFLATERDIRECCRLLENKFANTVILPLFGRLPSGDQRRIFQKSTQLKIIVATNVAETSLTVPGIRYVIDSGYARISQYNIRAKTTSLPVTKISQASCDQRKGRCGRVGPGHCIRLYSEEDFIDRPQFTIPEIKRSNLAEVILQMTSHGLGNPSDFPFLEPPFKNAIKEGYRLLSELGAIDSRMSLTKTGRFMADLPIDPCISRVILEAKEFNCLHEIKIISSILAIQDPRIRPAENEKAADTAHEKFKNPHSDFITILNLWNSYHKEYADNKSWSKLKTFCTQNFLSFQKMREWFDLHDQLDRLLEKRKGFSDNSSEASYEQIHRSILSGFLRNLAKKKRGRIFQGSHNKELMIFPGSGQFAKPPEWILGAAFIETNNLYALTVADINPEWVEPAASHLCKYSWSSPHWQKKSGQVVADETVSLFGLILSTGKKVNFGKRDKKNIVEARDIFIQEALVKGQLNGNYNFLSDNLAQIKHWEESEEKLRVRNIVADDLSFYTFYAAKIPETVYDQRTLNKFLSKRGKSKFLHMTDQDILLRQLDENELVNFPATTSIGAMQLRLEYHFEPGADRDGVTFRLPLSFAGSVSPGHFDWLVPGLLHEKITFLFKSLPKSIRKRLVPISESVSQVLDDVESGKGPLLPALEQSILKQFNFLIDRKDWKLDFPQHLQPRFLLFDDSGKEYCSGRNLASLLENVSKKELPAVSANYSNIDKKILDHWQDSEHKTWDFKGLPDEISTYTTTGEVSGFLYTALSPQPNKGCVSVTFSKDKEAARKTNTRGTLFLFCLEFKDQYKSLKKLCSTALSGPSTMLFVKFGRPRNEIVELALTYVLTHLVGPIPPGIIDETSYNTKRATVGQQGLFKEGQKYLDQLLSSLRKRRETEELIKNIFKKGKQKGHFLPPLQKKFISDLDSILPHDFLLSEHTEDFTEINRQFHGLAIRVERFYANPGKDAQKAKQLEPHLSKLNELLSRKKDLSKDAVSEMYQYQKMINDFRLSLFSPEIRSRQSVSSKKLELQWQITLAKC